MAKQAKVLTDLDAKRIRAVIAQDRYADRNRALFMVFYLAGFRACEIASLTIGSVLTRTGEIADRITLLKSQTKGHEARSVPIARRLRKELEAYVETMPNPEANRPLFASQKGGRFDAHGVFLLLKRIFAEAGVAGASSHSGRRTFATRPSSKGVGIRVIQALLGHAAISSLPSVLARVAVPV